MRRVKYKERKDGKGKETTKTYDGVRKHFYGKTDEEIDAKIAAFEKAREKPAARKFKDVADAWWGDKYETISINSVGTYKKAKSRAVEEFGEMPVDEITPQMVIQWLRRLAAQGLSQKVINNTKVVFKNIMDCAFVEGEISANPAVGLPIIKGEPKVPREPASDEDIKRIEASKTESLISRMYYFMLYTGARLGEASALQQKDIDVKNCTAKVNKSLAYGGHMTPIIKEPKTAAGNRTLELLDNVIDVLPTYNNPETYIFFPEGFPHRFEYEESIRKYREAHGIAATPHQLRHSFASMLHSAGVDVKDAQELLGHSTIAMTQDIYTHLEKSKKEEVRKNLNRYIEEKK